MRRSSRSVWRSMYPRSSRQSSLAASSRSSGKASTTPSSALRRRSFSAIRSLAPGYSDATTVQRACSRCGWSAHDGLRARTGEWRGPRRLPPGALRATTSGAGSPKPTATPRARGPQPRSGNDPTGRDRRDGRRQEPVTAQPGIRGRRLAGLEMGSIPRRPRPGVFDG